MVDIRENGSVEGDITAPRVAIAEGAHFRGSVDMQATKATKPAAQAPRPTSPQEMKPMAAQPVVVSGQQGQQGQRLGA